MSILSLCSGYGGLELAIQATFGPQAIDAAKRRLLGNGVAPQQGHLGIYRAWKQHSERNQEWRP